MADTTIVTSIEQQHAKQPRHSNQAFRQHVRAEYPHRGYQAGHTEHILHRNENNEIHAVINDINDIIVINDIIDINALSDII